MKLPFKLIICNISATAELLHLIRIVLYYKFSSVCSDLLILGPTYFLRKFFLVWARRFSNSKFTSLNTHIKWELAAK